MRLDGQLSDPSRMDLQWFAEEGNPEPASGEGTNAAEGFATELASASPGSGSESASPDGAQDGQPGGSEGTAKAATPPAPPGWSASLTGATKSNAKIMERIGKFPKADDMVSAYFELEDKQGGMVTLPTESSSPEEIATFYAKIGVPSKPEEYKLDRTDGLDYDDSKESAFKAELHKNHVPQAVANWIYKQMGESTKTAILAYQARKEEDKSALRAKLEKEHGKDYGAFILSMQQGIAKYGTPELMKDLKDSGLEYKESVVRFFASLGLRLKPDSALQRGGQPTVRKSNAEVLGRAILGKE